MSRRPVRGVLLVALHLVALVLVALVLVALPGSPAAAPAAAHTGLASSSPSDGAVLTEPPVEVRLRFTEALREPAYVVVTAPDGTRSASRAVVQGSEAVQPLPVGRSAEGVWRTAFRVVSADGHPITGELAFTVDAAGSRDGGTLEGDDPPAPAPSAAGDSGWSRPRTIALGAGVLAVLAALTVLARPSRRSRP